MKNFFNILKLKTKAEIPQKMQILKFFEYFSLYFLNKFLFFNIFLNFHYLKAWHQEKSFLNETFLFQSQQGRQQTNIFSPTNKRKNTCFKKRNVICNCEFQPHNGQKNFDFSLSKNDEKTKLNSSNIYSQNENSVLKSVSQKQENPKKSIFGKLFFFAQNKSNKILKTSKEGENNFSNREGKIQKVSYDFHYETFPKNVQEGFSEGLGNREIEKTLNRSTNARDFRQAKQQKTDRSNFSTASATQKKKPNSLKRQNSSLGLSSDQKKNSRFSSGWTGEAQKQQVVSITYEEIGLFPRSFNRVFDRFFKQLFFDVENFVIQEYRFYRYLFLTTVKCLFILLFVPLSVNFLAKNYFIRPITEYFWNTQNHEIFLNSYQQKKAFSEFKNFEEKIYFESFLFSENSIPFDVKKEKSFAQTNFHIFPLLNGEQNSKTGEKNENFSTKMISKNKEFSETENSPKSFGDFDVSTNFQNSLQKRLQRKIIELANHYNEESIEAVTNFFADILSFGTLWFLLVRLEIQINITKSFLLEVFFGLDDSKKSLLILFLTDLLVGYHSPNIWELFFQTLFDHYGLPESQTTIFLLVATLPVLLDVLFKYLIFRHLNRASPATVATYHAMIE